MVLRAISQLPSLTILELKTLGTQHITPNNNLYGKFIVGDPSETGLGLVQPNTQDEHEIEKTTFIQLDFTKLPSTTQSVDLYISSIQAGETATIWGSDTLGMPGTFLTQLTGSPDVQFFTINSTNLQQYRYYSISTNPTVTGNNNNILIRSGLLAQIDEEPGPPISIPEPSAIFGLAALGVGASVKRLFSKK